MLPTDPPVRPAPPARPLTGCASRNPWTDKSCYAWTTGSCSAAKPAWQDACCAQKWQGQDRWCDRRNSPYGSSCASVVSGSGVHAGLLDGKAWQRACPPAPKPLGLCVGLCRRNCCNSLALRTAAPSHRPPLALGMASDSPPPPSLHMLAGPQRAGRLLRQQGPQHRPPGLLGLAAQRRLLHGCRAVPPRLLPGGRPLLVGAGLFALVMVCRGRYALTAARYTALCAPTYMFIPAVMGALRWCLAFP